MTTSQRVYSEITERIMTGKLLPGHLLPERALAEELGVSRTPVREALARLQSEGLVVRGPQALLKVVEPTIGEVCDLLDLRELIEGLAARRAAERASRIEAELLLASARELDAEGVTVSQEVAFHRTLVRLAQHASLARTFQSQSLVQYSWILTWRFDPASDNRFIRHPHAAIAHAVLDGDAEAAERAAWNHIVEVREALLRHALEDPNHRRQFLGEPTMALRGVPAPTRGEEGWPAGLSDSAQVALDG